MKLIVLLIICLISFQSCKNKTSPNTEKPVQTSKATWQNFGRSIIPDDAIDISSMAKHFETMQTGDSINSKVKAKVNSVCQAQGCWMRLDLENGQEMMVKFKDYGFFVPKDIAGKEVIVNGKAFVEEMSVDEQRHYAKDAQKTEKEIAQITTPKRSYLFEANGVLLIN